VPDFTSSTYLGLRHASVELAPWPRLTTGQPGALLEPPVARTVARTAARLVGCDAALLGASTLHLAWDLGAWLAPTSSLIVDHSAYPILVSAAERARGRGIPVTTFDGHDIGRLKYLVGRAESQGRQPIVLTDGYCPACRQVSPLPAYARVVERAGGLVIVDDTQALGVLGTRGTTPSSFGSGGGGALAWSGVRHPRVVVVASLAKGFGAPLAILAGSRAIVRSFARASGTRVHCSAPSFAALHAAARALAINAREGDAIRLRLSMLVDRFRARMRAAGVRLTRGPFPVQSLEHPRGSDAMRLHAELARAGVSTVLTGERGPNSARLTFVLTAAHRPQDIDHAASATADALARIVGPRAGRRNQWASA
jgi:8-amino-7-oxononanoate synthase